MTITEDQATAFLRDDLADAESVVDAATSASPTTDNQFAAMASLCFNIGGGNFRDSSVLRFHLESNAAAAADAFLLWNKARVNGQLVEVQGLVNRRQKERTLYLA